MPPSGTRTALEPSNIIKDQQGFFVVVATRKNLGSSAYATEMVRIDPSGTQVWISAPYMPTGGATAHSVAEYGQGAVLALPTIRL